MNSLRLALLTASTLLFAWFAAKDMRFHHRGRAVSTLEEVLHAALGVAQFILIAGAFRGSFRWTLIGAIATSLFGAADEYVFHRGIPGEESALHAKAHFALFIVVVIALGLPLGVPNAH